MQPPDTELDRLSYSEEELRAHLVSKYFNSYPPRFTQWVLHSGVSKYNFFRRRGDLPVFPIID